MPLNPSTSAPSPDDAPRPFAKQRTTPARTKRWFLAIGIAALALALATGGYVAATYRFTHPSPTARVFVRPEAARGLVETSVVWRVETKRPEYALTFDDGPDPRWTPQVLRMLAAHHAHATFFMLGDEAQANPGLVRQVVAAGNEVAIHGWTHAKLTFMSTPQIQQALGLTSRTLMAAGAPKPVLFRPTYGRIDSPGLGVASADGLTVVMWSHHITGSTPARDRAQIDKTASPGMIVLAHDGRTEPNAQMMTQINGLLGDLENRGLTSVTVSQLMTDSTRDSR
ncbi:MAG: polysaccharide deacetylase family protein [Bifidobacteriaceae bacterium]|jgi:peptidoglycan/xylan/chitin deacetylase (PgdA/CDA1 family)|nr:polysaccharide deacetylase family protein [Bifidobacteriaceae bacterium]